MALAVGFGGEGVLALAALVRPLPVVGPHVPDQRPFVPRTLFAHVASVRRPRQMHPIVTCTINNNNNNNKLFSKNKIQFIQIINISITANFPISPNRVRQPNLSLVAEPDQVPFGNIEHFQVWLLNPIIGFGNLKMPYYKWVAEPG